VVSGLTNGTSYTFTVVATNSAGDSPASQASNAVTPRTVPGAPTGVTAVPGINRAEVSFASPVDDGGSEIISYTAVASPGGIAASASSSPIIIESLVNGQEYSFTVVARNALGLSEASTPSDPVVVGGVTTDLSATITNNVDFLRGGSTVIYYLTVINLGIEDVVDASVQTTIPGNLGNIAWSCSAEVGSACPSTGIGEIDVAVDLAAEGFVEFLIFADVSRGNENPVTVTGSVTGPANVNDSDPSNNLDSDGPDVVGLFRDRFEAN
jgi:uncharacterized repeat protein (TIGR01451 family)